MGSPFQGTIRWRALVNERVLRGSEERVGGLWWHAMGRLGTDSPVSGGGTQVAAEANPPKHGHFLRADTVSPSEEAISDTVRTLVKVAADTAGL